VFFASLEEDPQDLLVRLVQTAAGKANPTAADGEWFGFAYAERLRVWGVIGIARHRKLIGTIQELAKQGVTHAIIDSLMCLDIDNDDYEAQRQFANLLSATARASKIHIHLVAHPRKAISSNQEPDLNDVAGAREIGGIADNVVFVRRDTSKPDFGGDTVGMKISIRKQRHGTGMLGEVTGFFRRDLKQFQHGEFLPATRYLPPQAYL
jgi:twinkle protein